MRRSSVVLPDPFGPSTPTTAPPGTSMLTESRTRRGGTDRRPLNTAGRRRSASYENETLSTSSNTHSDETRAAERREPQNFLVLPVRDVVDAAEELEPRRPQPHSATQIDDRVAWSVEQAAERPVIWLDVERLRSPPDRRKCRVSSHCVSRIERHLVPGTADERVADLERWRRRVVESVDREGFSREPGIGGADAQSAHWLRAALKLQSARARIRDVVAAVMARVCQGTPDGDDEVVVLVPE